MGVMDQEFRERVLTSLRALKFDFDLRPEELAIPIARQGCVVGRLRPIHANFTFEDIRLLVEWRNQNREAFFSWFTATEEGTGKWLREQILAREDRILFFIETLEGMPFGHVGLTNFDFSIKACEVDNVLRGKSGFVKGGMSIALQALVNWVFTVLGASLVYLRVFSDNRRALDFYMRIGFELVKRVPLRRVEDGKATRWVEAEEGVEAVFEKYVSYLKVERAKYAGVEIEPMMGR